MRLPGKGTTERRRLVLLAVAAVVLVAYLLIRSRIPEPDLQELLADISRFLGEWTYLLVGGLAYLETAAFIGFVAPGEVAVILGGAVAGQGEISLVLMLGIAWVAAFLGDSTGFLIGHRVGREFLCRHGSVVGLTEERFAHVERYFQRHGGATIVIGRFLGLVRPLAPFIASSSGMAYRTFAPYSVLGTGLWAATFTVLGYLGSQSIDRVAEVADRGVFLFGTVIAVIVGVVVITRFLRVSENRRRLVRGMEDRAALRPLVSLGRRLSPAARFAWNRVTPGGLGLELSTLLAILAVGIYIVVLYAVILTDDPGPTPGDVTALDLARDLRTDWLTDVMRVVTDLGSVAVTVPIAACAGIFLIWRGRWAELGVLIGGLAIAHIAVPELKEAIDRPRPPNPIDDSSGDAYPSGHATYSVIYVWLAVTVAFRIAPGLTIRSALIAAGVAITGLVGLSRVYLGVHYLSDVTGGWALGASAFALCAVIALIATHLRVRDNGAAYARGQDRA